MAMGSAFKLLVIIPNSNMGAETLAQRKQMLESFAIGGLTITVEDIPDGPESIESEYEEAVAGRYVLERISKLKAGEFDAVVIYCFDDPVVNAARELSPIPVIGPGHATVMVAQDLADRYSIITMLEEMIPLTERKIRQFGFDFSRCASIRCSGIPVSKLRDDMEKTYSVLLDLCQKCIKEDSSQAIVLGCLGMAGLGRRLSKALGIPVLDPAEVSVRYAELLLHSELFYSRISYPKFTNKEEHRYEG